MDSGWAAVLGASVTAVAAVGTATTSGWLMHRQVRTVAWAEHRRERVGPREEAYKKFLQPALGIRDHLLVVYDEHFEPSDINSEFMEGVRHAYSRMYEQQASLLIAGPLAVSTAAEKMIEDVASLEMHLGVFRHAPLAGVYNRIGERIRDLNAHTQDFAKAARLALDEESSATPRRRRGIPAILRQREARRQLGSRAA